MLNATITSHSIPIGQLQESPTNPRRTFSEEVLQELADSGLPLAPRFRQLLSQL